MAILILSGKPSIPQCPRPATTWGHSFVRPQQHCGISISREDAMDMRKKAKKEIETEGKETVRLMLLGNLVEKLATFDAKHLLMFNQLADAIMEKQGKKEPKA